MKIYTRTGDRGQTGLFGGDRVTKSHPLVEAYGTIDELNSVLGMAAAVCEDADLRARLTRIQGTLFDVGADVATPPVGPASTHVPRTTPDLVAAVETDIDVMSAGLSALGTFILPGGTPTSAALHQARTVCRRAERRIVTAIEEGSVITPAVVAYLNRLGDWLFVAARQANHRAGVPDVPWQGPAATA